MRPRHSDTDLLELARAGSAPAFASVLHRNRDVIQRGALRAQRPERLAEAVMTAAVRAVRRGRIPGSDLRGWLAALVDAEVRRDPGDPGVERLLPADWFDRVWVRVERRWPTGRRPLRAPRWALQMLGAVALAAGGAGASYLVVTAETPTEVLTELVAVPIEDPDVLVVPGPVVEPEPEEAPELFGDIELGELPSYDLSGGGVRSGGGATLAPRPPQQGADGGGAAADGADTMEDGAVRGSSDDR